MTVRVSIDFTADLAGAVQAADEALTQALFRAKDDQIRTALSKAQQQVRAAMQMGLNAPIKTSAIRTP